MIELVTIERDLGRRRINGTQEVVIPALDHRLDKASLDICHCSLGAVRCEKINLVAEVLRREQRVHECLVIQMIISHDIVEPCHIPSAESLREVTASKKRCNLSCQGSSRFRRRNIGGGELEEGGENPGMIVCPFGVRMGDESTDV